MNTHKNILSLASCIGPEPNLLGLLLKSLSIISTPLFLTNHQCFSLLNHISISISIRSCGYKYLLFPSVFYWKDTREFPKKNTRTTPVSSGLKKIISNLNIQIVAVHRLDALHSSQLDLSLFKTDSRWTLTFLNITLAS